MQPCPGLHSCQGTGWVSLVPDQILAVTGDGWPVLLTEQKSLHEESKVTKLINRPFGHMQSGFTMDFLGFPGKLVILSKDSYFHL